MRLRPRDYLIKGHAWPEGRLIRSAPTEAKLLHGIATRLRTASETHTLEQATGVSKGSLSRLMRGETWASARVIARLETVLDTDLWGDERREA